MQNLGSTVVVERNIQSCRRLPYEIACMIVAKVWTPCSIDKGEIFTTWSVQSKNGQRKGKVIQASGQGSPEISTEKCLQKGQKVDSEDRNSKRKSGKRKNGEEGSYP